MNKSLVTFLFLIFGAFGAVQAQAYPSLEEIAYFCPRLPAQVVQTTPRGWSVTVVARQTKVYAPFATRTGRYEVEHNKVLVTCGLEIGGAYRHHFVTVENVGALGSSGHSSPVTDVPAGNVLARLANIEFDK